MLEVMNHISTIIRYLFLVKLLSSAAPLDALVKPHLYQQILLGDKNYNVSENIGPKELEKSDNITLKGQQINDNISSLCWVESLVLTEQKGTKNKTQSKEYSVILESPANIPIEFTNMDVENSFCEHWENQTLNNKILNCTTVKETEDLIITEHKALFCGTGPILSKQYVEWPKLNRKRIEFKISSVVPSVWKMYGTNKSYPASSSTTFDTTVMTTEKTESTPQKLTPMDPIVGKIKPRKSIIHTPDKTYTPPTPRKKQTYNHLINRNINYTSCNKSRTIINPFEQTSLLNSLKTTRKPILLKTLFPKENIFSDLQRDDKDRAFLVKVKVTVDCKELDDKDHNEEEEDGSKLEMEEESLFVLSSSCE